MKQVLVNFTNGNQIRTAINGTDLQIHRYYAAGRMFNLGIVTDDMQPVASIVIEPDQYNKAIALFGMETNTIDIITQEGGLVSIYDDQEMCYQNRIDITNEDWFTPLTEGKGYCSCHEKQSNYEKIVCALEWLGYNILETDLKSIYVANDAMETITPHILNFLKPYQCQAQTQQ